MKKSIFLIVALLCMPLPALAMKVMDDRALEEISGQSGVSIFVDITMNIHIDTLAWGDSDGLGANNIWGVETRGGHVGVTGLTVTGLALAHRAPNSVGFWPDPGSIDVVNGVPYYRVHAGPGMQ
ncbi:MAG TPA: hypothetical protein PKM41_13415 [Deltaproteobacteria bacterium]|mgnify:CR=1 FL=1|nr:hypothetical protein [Deltaproteobacteria bacterium]HOI07546.1 hypothetical protein [Deltaproteobacteria bacterium]